MTLPRTSWLTGWAVDWLCILAALVVAVVWPVWWVVLLAAWWVGVFQHRVALLGHDAAHKLAHPNRLSRWNAVACMVTLWPLGLTTREYLDFHLKHHRKVGTGEDPETHLRDHRVLGQWVTPTTRKRVAVQFMADLIGAGAWHLEYTISLMKPRIWPGLAVLFLMLVAGLAGFWAIPLVWYGGLLTSFWAVFRLRVWTEHIDADDLPHHTPRLSRPPAWARWLFLGHNTWCHHAHHANPSVPFEKLPFEATGVPAMTLSELVTRLTTQRAARAAREQ